MNDKYNPAKIISDYNDTNREKFNPVLFERSDQEVIDALKQVILSCQRTKYTVIRVINFEVITGYEEVRNILYSYENQRIKKSKKIINPYSYIDLKDSDIYLLKVNYYIAAKDGEMTLPVYIALPRFVDKYYFRIAGNNYFPMSQIADNSTYNNTMASSSKRQSVTLKTVFMPIRIYREIVDLVQRNNEVIKAVYYSSIIFSKKLSALKYILAKLGLRDGLMLMGYSEVVSIIDSSTPRGDNDSDIFYYFGTSCPNIIIKTPKVVFDGDYVLQSLIYTLVSSITSDTTPNDIFTNDFWLISLGGEYKNFSADKGMSVLDSLESLYDNVTYNDIKIPPEKKQSIYHIILWMVREFPRLRAKDNLNLSYKKIRIAEYIALLYSSKLSRGIYTIADSGTNVTLGRVKKALNILPLTLINKIKKNNLINYSNSVNDMDSTFALKFTYKGISGIGDSNNGKSVPDTYRMVHPSHIGRVDLDTSSATDPGMSGILCPFAKIYEDGRFSENDEPNEWEDEFAVLMNNYKKIINLKDIIQMEKTVLHIENPVRVQMIEESQKIMDGLIRPIQMVVNDQGVRNHYNNSLDEN